MTNAKEDATKREREYKSSDVPGTLTLRKRVNVIIGDKQIKSEKDQKD